MGGAFLLGLFGKYYLWKAVQVDSIADFFLSVAHNNGNLAQIERFQVFQNVLDHGFSRYGQSYLGQLGFHPGAFSSGQDYGHSI